MSRKVTDDDQTVANEMPLVTREASIRSFNEKDRTVEMVWTTGAAVRRYDWWNDRAYMEELVVTPEAVRMGRMESGAPVLDSHRRYDLATHIGVVESASISNGQGRATVRMSGREEVAGIVRDIQDGIIRNVSVGYITHKIDRVAPLKDGDMWIYRVIDWEPIEVSFVSVGADAGSGTREETSSEVRAFPVEFLDQNPAQPAEIRKEVTMTEEEKRAAAEEKARADKEAADKAKAEQRKREEEQESATRRQKEAEEKTRAEAIKAERERATEVRALGEKAGMTPDFTARMVDDGISVQKARDLIFDELVSEDNKAGNRTQSRRSNIETTRDETRTIHEGVQNAILNRADPQGHPLDDNGRQYRGSTLIDLGRMAIERAGGSADGLSRRDIAVASLNMDQGAMARAGMISSSDFPLLTESTVNRTLRAAYELAPQTFRAWARQTSLPDFREISRVSLSDLSNIKRVNEGGAYKHTSFETTAEAYKLAKYGGVIAFTWESMINDDLDAFSRLPMMVADEVAANEGDIVYGILNSNGNMSDGNALFSSGHANLAASGGAINVDNLSKGRVAVSKQTAPQGRMLNLRPSILLVGPDNEQAANQYTSTNFVAAQSSNINPAYNTTLEVVSEQRISDTAWYLMCQPGRIDTVEFAYLDGEEGVHTETRSGFDVDGVEMKVRHVFAAKAIDHRGMYKNPGA